ncbi:glycosyltransferase family 87 protein [Fontivita pretiosa]|uniref:glycosyltransferase family 87 protein n=1 Tax=Fontivita pretiosa TaxID=2989684 RepID=UPI003D186940
MLRPASLRKRLWQAAGLLVLLLATLVVGNLFVDEQRAVTARLLGHDFLAFYTAGTFVRTGQIDKLYDLNAVRAAEHQVAQLNGLELGGAFGPYWNPPWYAWLLWPLSALPYRVALAVWTGMNLICLAVAVVLLVRMLPAVVARPPRAWRIGPDPIPLKFARDWRNWLLVPLLIVCSMPFIQAITHGQNTCISLLLLTLTVTAWRARRPLTAGLVCGLMLYKPQLVAVLAGVLVLNLGLRALIGIGLIASATLIATQLLLPAALDEYLYRLPLNLAAVQIDQTYLWERHVTLQAFWRLLYQGRGAGPISGVVSLLSMLSTMLLGAGLLLACWRSRGDYADDCWTGETAARRRDRLISAAILTTPLLMPFYFDYDLLLLAAAAVLLAGEVLSRPDAARFEPTQRLLIGTWIGLYGWLMVNAPLAAASGVNVTVLLLCTISGLTIWRACRAGVSSGGLAIPSPAVDPASRLYVIVRRAA